ncbi:MAG TPA: radical SAM protein [Myxococcaceae bacterium]|nr:radical SAM protein [Myxococcaceae bacterium]
MKILFIATRKNCDPQDRELYEMDLMNRVLGFKRSLFDLGLYTVAACTPADVEVELHDEYLAPIDFDTDADLIALSAKTSAVARAYQVAEEFRRRGKKVVLGGIHASLRPQEALERVDYVVLGEAERSWPRFVELFKKGEAPRLMPSDGFMEMGEIPVPRWNKAQYREFLFHQVQTTRGCPFTCRFCSVPDISGNAFRMKPPEKVVEEIRAFPRTGLLRDQIRTLYFVDDNFISRPSATHSLMDALLPLRKKGELGEWSAETTLNVAADQKLLDKFAAAGCGTLIIGFESVSEDTLLTMDKKVNFALTYQEAIKRIHDRGMSIVGNFIVGFDTDTVRVFEDTLKFIDDNVILYPFFSILTPMPGTKLHDEYRDAGRLDHTDWSLYDTRHVVFEPKQMSREQLMDGYIYLYEQAYASARGFDRMERYWSLFRRRRSTVVENAFIRMKLRKVRGRSARMDALVKDGLRRLAKRGHNSDVGQLLYYLDSADFVDFLDRYRSPQYAEHARLFANDLAAPDAAKQWEHDRRRRAPRPAPASPAA